MLTITREDASGIELQTAEPVAWSVIWLHGLGADGSDFVPIVPALSLAENQGVRFLFPHAPYRRVTCNGGYEMRAWYDILSLAPESRRIDEAGLVESVVLVHRLIEQETARGIPPEHIFLAGFSQGGAVAYAAGLSYPQRLAGLLALSTYIPSTAWLDARRQPANQALPIAAGHGAADSVVAPALGRAARDWLAAAGYPLEWREYPMEHEVCLEEIQWLGAWLNRRFTAAA